MVCFHEVYYLTLTVVASLLDIIHCADPPVWLASFPGKEERFALDFPLSCNCLVSSALMCNTLRQCKPTMVGSFFGRTCKTNCCLVLDHRPLVTYSRVITSWTYCSWNDTASLMPQRITGMCNFHTVPLLLGMVSHVFARIFCPRQQNIRYILLFQRGSFIQGEIMVELAS